MIFVNSANKTELANGLECDSPRKGPKSQRAEPTVVFHRLLTNMLPGDRMQQSTNASQPSGNSRNITKL